MGSRDSDQNAGHPTTSLNLDVLRTVITFLSVTDLKEVAIISNPLREEALREILTRGVHLGGKTSRLISFCRFMLKRDPPLYPFLHKLVLEHVPDRPRDGFDFNPDDLLEVLSRATYLRDLRIRWSDWLFTTDSDKRLPVTLPHFQNLRRLEIWTRQCTTDPSVAETLLALRSQLRILEVPHEEDNRLPRDFPNLLAERQRSLHRLRICYPDFTSVPWVPLPSIRVLFLTVGNKIPSLPHIAQIFPNVRELAVFAVGFEVDFVHPAPEHVKARQDAIAFQRSGGGWKSLDVLMASSLGDPWVLCVTCPVGSVRLGHYDSGSHAAFVDVVSRTRPKKVSLILACAQYCVKPEEAPNMFVFLADAEGAAGGVTHAMLPFTISSFQEDQTTSGMVDVIVSHIKDSRIEYLHVAFAEFFMFSPEIDERVLNPRDTHPHVVEIIKEIDVALLVSGLAAAGQHLRVIVLTLATRDQSVWTIDRREGEQTVTRIENSYSARAIIEREERAYMYTS